MVKIFRDSEDEDKTVRSTPVACVRKRLFHSTSDARVDKKGRMRTRKHSLQAGRAKGKIGRERSCCACVYLSCRMPRYRTSKVEIGYPLHMYNVVVDIVAINLFQLGVKRTNESSNIRSKIGKVNKRRSLYVIYMIARFLVPAS